jgi:DNA polymerase elongation subunit (family B)
MLPSLLEIVIFTEFDFKPRESALDFCYLLDVKTEGRIVTLRFHDSRSEEPWEVRDWDYKPYFYLPYPLSQADEGGVRTLYGGTQAVRKRVLLTDEVKDYAKVTVLTLDALHKASRIFNQVWESEIDYGQCYVYDRNLVFGALYTRKDNQLILADKVPQELEARFEAVFSDTKTADPQKYAQIRYWFSLLQQPIPQVKPEQLGVDVIDSERLHHAFMLARIANVPVKEAYHSHRVSDWLKSMIYTYLRKDGVLIPTSTELRRGLETHTVAGALTVQPKAGTYFNTVVCDFESLYPSIIDSYNLSYETVNCAHPECRTNRIKECEDHWVCTRRRGFWSVLVGAIKDLRIRWFKPLSKNTAVSEEERKTAYAVARLLKLISVSSYGVTVRIHGLACPPLAECITGYGRWALQTTWNMAESNGMRPTYGDTDSIFLDNPQQTQVEWLINTVKEKLKLDLAIEKQYSLCVLPAAKKAYYGILIDGTPDLKGLTAIKSNSPKFIQKVFQDCVRELTNIKNLAEYEEAKKRIVTLVQKAVEDLRTGKVPFEDLVYSVQLNFDPRERQTASAEQTPQPYQCAVQLLGRSEKVERGDVVNFIKVKPFYFRGKVFTVKPAKYVGDMAEINVDDYVRNLSTALAQTFKPMGISLERSEERISRWL